MAEPKILNRKRALILIPNLVGYSGDVINEVQLAKNLCRELDCLILGFVPILKLPLLRRFIADLRKDRWMQNSIVLPLPILRPYSISLPLVSILLAPIILLLDRLKHFKFIYVRLSTLASALMLIPSLARKTCVKIPAIFEDEERGLGRIFSFIHRLADRLALDRAGCICVPSPLLLKEIALRRGLSPKGKVIWVPSGIDREKVDTIKKQTRYHGDIREEYIIGFMGLLKWWQGVDILVKAVAKIKHSLDKPVKLLIVGDGPERRKIEKLCTELKVDCHITGFVRHEEALKYLLSFDVLVVPRIRSSTTESVIPIKIIEAWALGVPIVVTKHKIYDHIGLKDGGDIVFCEPDPDDVAEKILMVLRDEGLRRKLSERGPRLAESFHHDKIDAGLINAFRGSETYASA